MTARLLAFDTSTETLAVAVHHAGGTMTHCGHGGSAASARLLPEGHALLARAGLRLADLDAIAFGRGPGAFTGLRTSAAAAQGLAWGLGVPVLAVDSLLVVAEDARLQTTPGADGVDITVAMDARMDEVYAGRYRWRGGRWHTVQAPALHTLAAFCASMTQAAPAGWLAGSALAAFGDRLAVPARLSRVPAEHDRAGALMRLALALHADGGGVDAAAALPLYLRDDVAQTTVQRDAARRAAAA